MITKMLENLSYILKMMDVDLDLEMENVIYNSCPVCGDRKKTYKLLCAKCNIPMRRMRKRYYKNLTSLKICCQDSIFAGIFVCATCDKTLTATITTGIRLRDMGLL